MPIPLGSRHGLRSRELALPRTARPPDIDLERPACFGSFRRRAVKQPTYGIAVTLRKQPTCIGSHDKLTFNARRCASLATLRHRRHITIPSRSDPSLHHFIYRTPTPTPPP